MTPEFIKLRCAFYRMLGRMDMSRRLGKHERASLQLKAAGRIHSKILKTP